MNAIVALLVIIVALLVYSLAQQNKIEPPVKETPESTVLLLQEGPRYDYPVSPSVLPWRIPAYSYGSMHDYRRFHSPRNFSGFRPSPVLLGAPAIHGHSGNSYSAPYPVVSQFPSMVPRAGMSHPQRNERRRLR